MKHTHLALAFLLTLGGACASAQDAPARWSLDLAAGPASPIGSFHSIASMTSNSGYARTGYGAQLSGSYRIYHRLGVTLAAGYQQNPTATTLRYYDEANPLNVPPSTISHKHWTMTRILAGPSWSLPLAPKKGLSLRIQALAGALKTKIPDLTMYTPGLPNALVKGSWYYQSYGPLPWCFAYQADAGLQWRVNRRLALTLDAGYDGSELQATYNTTENYTSLPPIPGIHTFPNQSVRMSSTVATGTLYTRLGIGIAL
jgi:hypothetical protein